MKTKGKIDLLGNMAHARRYFVKAKDNDFSRAEYVLPLMQKLYAIEKKLKNAKSQFKYFKDIENFMHYPYC